MRLRRILRTPEAAEYTGLGEGTLEKMRVKAEGPPFIHLGGRAIGYDIADLDRWLDGQRQLGEAYEEKQTDRKAHS